MSYRRQLNVDKMQLGTHCCNGGPRAGLHSSESHTGIYAALNYQPVWLSIAGQHVKL